MAEIQKVSKDSVQEKLNLSGSEETREEVADSTVSKSSAKVAHEHKSVHEGKESPEKGKELPEPLRPGNGKDVMPGLPPINMTELTTMLRSPNMPAQKIMKEVADKMMLKSEESESDDGSVGSSGGVGMKGLFDCILEVSLLHPDSDNDDEDDDPDESAPREISCTFCNKIFGSTMTWKTHVLVAHPLQDPSVLNLRRLSINDPDSKEKGRPGHRKRSKGSSKSDCDRDNKSRHPSKSDNKGIVDIKGGEENVPASKRRSSLSRSHQMGTTGVISEHKSHSQEQVIQASSGPKDIGSAPPTSQGESAQGTLTTAADQPAKKLSTLESSLERKGDDSRQSSTQNVDSAIAADQPTSEISLSHDDPVAKKKRSNSSPAQPSSSPSSTADSGTSTEHSKKNETEESTTAPKRRQSDNSGNEITKKARVGRSKGGDSAEKPTSVPTRRSTRHQK